MNDPQLERLLGRHYAPSTPSPEFVARLRRASQQVYRESFLSPWRQVPWWLWTGLLIVAGLVLLAFWRPWETLSPLT